jgi:hydroxymethylpyrimidine pyrophosphatase-like HAD family hydrolase
VRSHAPTAVFLDIDGTLVDSNEPHVGLAQAFLNSGNRLEKDAIRLLIGKARSYPDAVWYDSG